MGAIDRTDDSTRSWVSPARAFDFGRALLRWAWSILGPFVWARVLIVEPVWVADPATPGSFLEAYNWRTIAVQTVIVGTAALGMTAIMICGWDRPFGGLGGGAGDGGRGRDPWSAITTCSVLGGP